jgi:hypothetical protein
LEKNPIVSVRDIEISDSEFINKYWSDNTEEDLLRMGELGRPDQKGTADFIRALCIERPTPAKAEEGILIWCFDGRAIDYSTLKEIRFQSDAQIHLHMWERESRGKGVGAVLFCLSALEFIKRFELKKLYCQPKADNPMPNGMLRRIGFTELPQINYPRRDGSVIKQSRYLIASEVAERYLASANNQFNGSRTYLTSEAD